VFLLLTFLSHEQRKVRRWRALPPVLILLLGWRVKINFRTKTAGPGRQPGDFLSRAKESNQRMPCARAVHVRTLAGLVPWINSRRSWPSSLRLRLRPNGQWLSGRYVEVLFRGPASSSGLSAYAEGFAGWGVFPFKITDWSWLTPDKRLELFEAGFLAEFSDLDLWDMLDGECGCLT